MTPTLAFKKAAIAVLAYAVVSAVAAMSLQRYLEALEGTDGIPAVVWILAGPLIALATVHGIPAYVVATLVCLPLWIGAVIMSGKLRALLAGMGCAFWVLVGWFLY